ncbi:L,D-transpeptidase [Gottschalkia acidurici]|nr:L,D-transpeptidase [Gottschalkia acidurici]
MKKILIMIVVLSVIATSCNNKQNKKIKQNELNEENKKLVEDIRNYTGQELEPNVNYIPIKDDNRITKNMVKNIYDITLNKLKNFDKNTLTGKLNYLRLVEVYDTQIPNNINVDILYDKYNIPFDYMLITSQDGQIYEKPNTNSSIAYKAEYLSKIKLEGKLIGDDNKEWYIVSWTEDNDTLYGYAPTSIGEFRTFKFQKMIEEIERLDQEMAIMNYGYISNYKNKNGTAPLLNGESIDQYGIQAYQSADAYPNLENRSEFRYIPDGMIVFILEEKGDFYKVSNFEYEGEYWVHKKYVSFENNISSLTKAVVIDTTNQNEAVFEKRDNVWTIISYTLATTGAKEKYKYETPKGRFKVQEKRDKFYYINDETKELAGYGPYGTRFTAGAYIHGVPIDFQKKDGKNIDPGMKEYLATIGTTPRSHKCVRNYTSHAKFVYDWADLTSTSVIVID